MTSLADNTRKRLVYLLAVKHGLIQADESGLGWVNATRCGKWVFPSPLVERIKAKGFTYYGARYSIAELKGHPGKWGVQ